MPSSFVTGRLVSLEPYFCLFDARDVLSIWKRSFACALFWQVPRSWKVKKNVETAVIVRELLTVGVERFKGRWKADMAEVTAAHFVALVATRLQFDAIELVCGAGYSDRRKATTLVD
ncbi:hypothetical protein AgCh_034308 [Apium graveolens]